MYSAGFHKARTWIGGVRVMEATSKTEVNLARWRSQKDRSERANSVNSCDKVFAKSNNCDQEDLKEEEV